MAVRRAAILASRGSIFLSSSKCLPRQRTKLLGPFYSQAVLSRSYQASYLVPGISQHANFPETYARGSLSLRSNLLQTLRFLSSSSLPEHQEIGMPSLSPTMTQGNIAKWCKKEGDRVSVGEVLCEIETDKATLEMEAMEEGFVAKILLPEGAKDIPVGQAMAILVESEDDISKFSGYEVSAKSAPADSPSKEVEVSSPSPVKESVPKSPSPKPEAPRESTPSSNGRIFASPLAKKIAEESKVSLSNIKGSGPNGRILKADVEAYIASDVSPEKVKPVAGPASQEFLDYIDLPNSQIRRITAQRLLQSKQTIPHYYLTIAPRVDDLLLLRSKLNALQEKSGGKRISINDFVLKAAAMALRKVPECNSSWTDDYIRQYHSVNVGVAVQTDFGLLVPVVKDADKKGLATIADSVKSLAGKAKENKLKPADYEGGTFTVTNLGGPFGVKQFCGIINPPQACILAVGTIEKTVIPGEEPGKFSAGSFMSVTLSCDHRVVDGAIGARWLGAFKGYIEDPMTLLL